jgi:uncharacterized damage-inducible protein DinB
MTTATQAAPTTDFAAGFRDLLVKQLEQEMKTTKRVLAAVPDGKRDYRPDPHGRTAAELAEHIALTDVQFLQGINDLGFEKVFGDPEASKKAAESLPKSSAALADWYEKNFSAELEKVKKLTPEQLNTTIGFFGAFNLPAHEYLLFLNNHSVHHRGQLACYLRPCGGKVPDIYGGSYDEPWQG